MRLFATAGGGGEILDMCFFCPAFAMNLTFACLGIVGAKRGSSRLVVIAVLMAGLLGSVVLYADATHVPSKDPDEQNNETLARLLIGWWALSTGIVVGSFAWVAVKRLRNHKF